MVSCILGQHRHCCRIASLLACPPFSTGRSSETAGALEPRSQPSAQRSGTGPIEIGCGVPAPVEQRSRLAGHDSEGPDVGEVRMRMGVQLDLIRAERLAQVGQLGRVDSLPQQGEQASVGSGNMAIR